MMTTKSPRLFYLLLITLLLGMTIAILAPSQFMVSVYKLSLVTMGGLIGYWIDRWVFPYARPDQFSPDTVEKPLPDYVDGQVLWTTQEERHLYSTLFAASMLRRALIIFGVMVAIGLGA